VSITNPAAFPIKTHVRASVISQAFLSHLECLHKTVFLFPVL